MGVHNFAAKLHQGEEVEQLLDEYLEPSYEIRKATRDEQRHGIDRFLTHRETGDTCSVDYKADSWAARTGNAFIETVSVNPVQGGEHKDGWAITSQADFIFYYLVGKRKLYVIRMSEIRAALPYWRMICQPMVVANEGYTTEGLLVKLSDLERIAEAVVEVGA